MTRHVPAAVAALAAALLAIPAIRHWRERPPEPPPPPPPLRALWSPPADVAIGAGSDYVFGLALAPDGRRLVYPAAKDGVVALWLHDLRNGETHTLRGTEHGAAPFWSADATRVGFFADRRLHFAHLASGEVAALADAPSPRGGAWNASGDIIFAASAGGGLTRRAVDGSIAPFTTLDQQHGETAHAWPAFLDDGRHVVFLVAANDRARAGIWIASIDDPASRKRLVAADSQPIVAGDMLLHLTGNALVAQPINLETRELSGRSTAVGLNVGRGSLGQTFASAAGDVIMFGAPSTQLRQLSWRSRDGKVLGMASEPIDAWDLRISPDGRRVAVTEVDPQLRTLDIFIRSGSSPVGARLSPSTDVDESAVWSPDGLRIAWVSQRRRLLIRGAGAVLPEQTIATFDSPIQVWDWSRDGRSLLIGRATPATGEDLWIQAPREDTAAQPFDTRAFNQAYGSVSPDGRRIAYASDESGSFDIYVDSFPKPGERVRVTTTGGTEPRWSHNGGELYFRRGSEIHALTLGRTRAESAPAAALFDAGAPVRSYDVSPDGRFLVNIPVATNTNPAITIVHNWRTALLNPPDPAKSSQ
jgi:Tol biopolymer transport system component